MQATGQFLNGLNKIWILGIFKWFKQANKGVVMPKFGSLCNCWGISIGHGCFVRNFESLGGWEQEFLKEITTGLVPLNPGI
jgi:hypothetical protein